MVTLRRVRDADAFMLYRWWRHVETTRFNPVPHPALTWDEHVEWFISNYGNPFWFVGESDGEAVGVVRLDDASDGRWISIAVAPEHRGRGHGRDLIRLATNRMAGVLAKIHELNVASRKAFEAAGYRQIRAERPWLVYESPS